MQKFITLAAALILAGCSADASMKFQQSLTTFRSNVAAVNETIASVSMELASDCDEIQMIAGMLEPLAASSQKAKAGFAAANAGIKTWCQQPPSNIQTAVASTARIVANARAAYAAANGGGQ